MYYVLLVVSIILAVCKSSLYNSYAKRSKITNRSLFSFNAVSYGVAAVIALVGVLFSAQSVSLTTVICAFFYAAIVISLQTASITAMSIGAMSTTSICVMYGMIIPAVAGPIFWKEPIGILQIAGIVMMLASLWLIEGRGASRTRPTEKKWIPLAILAFILSGMAGVMEKIHQSTEAREERLPFVLVACAFMLAFSLSVLPFTKRVAESVAYLPTLGIAALSGLVIGFYSTVNLILSGKLDSMIYYPVANGGALILTVLASALLFKERMDKPKIIGTAIGLAGILCLSIPV